MGSTDPKSELDNVLTERNAAYGDFAVQGDISQQIKKLLQSYPGWLRLKLYQQEALETIVMKVSRLLNGDPDHEDSWLDIAGYATLVYRILKRPKVK